MPLISIKRYLDQFRPGAEAAAGLSLHAAACSVLMDEVDARLLSGESYAQLKQPWRGVSQTLAALDAGDNLGAFQSQATAVLAERQRLEGLREQTQGMDVRQMLGVLNDALLSLVSGNETSMDRLRRLEKALHRTSQLNDLVAMKASLTETMRLIREESEQARADGAQTIQRLDAELQKARAASQRLPGLPGRAEGIKALEVASSSGAPACLAVTCQLERLRILRNRFGGPIADDLLIAFAISFAGREGDQAYRWSEDAIVILHFTEESEQEKRGQLEARFESPFEYRVMTGGRAALLTVPIRWFCTSLKQARESSAAEEIEQFLKGQQWRP